MLLQGYSRADIRDELVVSLHTVHAHVHNLYVKCDVHSLEELTELASRITREGANQ